MCKDIYVARVRDKTITSFIKCVYTGKNESSIIMKNGRIKDEKIREKFGSVPAASRRHIGSKSSNSSIKAKRVRTHVYRQARVLW